MLRVTHLTLLASILLPILAIQVPFQWDTRLHLQEGNQGDILGDKDNMEWSLDRLPHPNDTDHLVFETVYSLLQHWPNTRMRNGHNIVPGVIPKGTLLYRGTNDNTLPPGPDWVSTDPEHSYIFCRDTPPPDYVPVGCWHFTLMTTRPLKVVYFDGTSAAKIPYGTMDTQDLLAWGEASSEVVFDEWQRIEALCKWGKRFNVDAFIRMEMNFEAMLCDFTSGISVVSLANLADRHTSPSESASSSSWFEVMNSGSWRNHFPGETRVQLDLAGLVSFYDTQLVPSLVDARAGQERWDHRVGNISSDDWSAVKSRLVAALIRPAGQSSGIDWRTLFQVIIDRFAGRLELTRDLLNASTRDPEKVLDLAKKAHTQLRIMLTPYILLSVMSTDPLNEANLDWTIPIYKLCATTHTKFLELDSTMTDSEKLLLRAARGTSQEICRVVTKMWAAGVYAGIDQSLNTVVSPDIAEVIHVWRIWAEDLNQLMTWLDWSVWIKCHPRCDYEEMCYLPTWPSGFPLFGRHRMPSPSDPERTTDFDMRTTAMESLAKAIKFGPDDWIRPQPKCIPRISPYNTE